MQINDKVIIKRGKRSGSSGVIVAGKPEAWVVALDDTDREVSINAEKNLRAPDAPTITLDALAAAITEHTAQYPDDASAIKSLTSRFPADVAGVLADAIVWATPIEN
jgi:hypothetical protein